MTSASSGVALVAFLLAGASGPRAAQPVNKGSAPGLIRAASQFVGVDLLDGGDGHLRGSFTQAEVQKLAAQVRSGEAREPQAMSGPWKSVLRIQTRSQGVYVVYLMDPDTFLLEVPIAVARQLGVKPGRPRYKRVEVTMHYERWLYHAMEARLGPSDTVPDLPPWNPAFEQTPPPAN